MNFYITFGVAYADEPHPVLGQVGHPSNIVKIIAEDEAQARQAAWKLGFAGIYQWDDKELAEHIRDYYTGGVVLEINLTNN